jgi:hypothetical protein
MDRDPVRLTQYACVICSRANPTKKNQEDSSPPYRVGDQIKVKLHDGRKVDATIRAVFQQDGDTKLNIDYGHEETATIGLWQIAQD